VHVPPMNPNITMARSSFIPPDFIQHHH
jgi:hypothetical protein